MTDTYSRLLLHCDDLPNIPWQERPDGCSDVVWRHRENPIINRGAIKSSNSIFNSAVVPFNGGFAGVFRCDSKARTMALHAGDSPDGVNWRIDEQPIRFSSPNIADYPFEYGYDPRVCRIDGKYYVTWCNGYREYPTIGLAVTSDFREFNQLDNAFLPFNRNGVLFPRKINGLYVMLSRPSDNQHTAFGDIFLSQSPDLCFWGRHHMVMQPTGGWQGIKIGAGSVPIETSEGWLMFYHGVLQSCNGFVYSMGGVLLDIDEPWKVIARSKRYLLAPHMNYECVGDVPNVVFPCAALADGASGRIAIYYGCADTAVGLAYCRVKDVIADIKNTSIY